MVSELEFRIEKLRLELYNLAQVFGITAQIVLAKSVELDQVLNQYDALRYRKRESSLSHKSNV